VLSNIATKLNKLHMFTQKQGNQHYVIRKKNSLHTWKYHHHHVHEGSGVFPLPWSSKWSWSLHLFFGRPMFRLPSGLYFSACLGSLFLSILCTCCSQFFWYCFISFTIFCAPAFSLILFFIPFCYSYLKIYANKFIYDISRNKLHHLRKV